MTAFRWRNGWDPLAGLRLVQRELERLSGRSGESRSVGGGSYPPVNVYNSEDNILVECELAGVARDSVDLSITGETLVIKGTKPATTESEEPDNLRFHRSERSAGDFSRTIVLPDRVESDRIEATMSDGLLRITLPKAEAARPKQIKVS
jgi:HSP20 family protein